MSSQNVDFIQILFIKKYENLFVLGDSLTSMDGVCISLYQLHRHHYEYVGFNFSKYDFRKSTEAKYQDH